MLAHVSDSQAGSPPRESNLDLCRHDEAKKDFASIAGHNLSWLFRWKSCCGLRTKCIYLWKCLIQCPRIMYENVVTNDGNALFAFATI